MFMGISRRVLAPRSDPTTMDFVCSCLSFKRRGLVKWHDAEVATREAEEVPCFSVLAVCTPPRHRKKGYASHMMKLLHWALAADSLNPEDFPKAWGEPPARVPGTGDAKFSVLYSDVGPEFYSLCGPTEENKEGWVVKRATSTVWKITDEAPNTDGFQVQDLRWRNYGDDEDIRALWTRDAEMLRKDLAVRKLDEDEGAEAATITLLPDIGVAAYQLPRSIWQTQHMYTLDTWGTELLDPTSPSTFATWAVDPLKSPPRLILTRVRANPETFSALVKRIMRMARQAGLEEVEIWGLERSLITVAESLGGKTAERQKTLPSVKWYGSESSKDINWAFNERFCCA